MGLDAAEQLPAMIYRGDPIEDYATLGDFVTYSGPSLAERWRQDGPHL